MRYLWSLILVACFSLAYGQEEFVPQTSFGINSGLNIALLNSSPRVTNDVRYAYTGGLVFRHISEPRLGIQMELNLSQRGWVGALDSVTTYQRNLTYIEFPVMTNISLGKKNWQILINVGPKISFLVGEALESDLTDTEIAIYPELMNTDNTFEAGVCVGLGVSRKTNIGTFQLEGRYNQAITNLFERTNIRTEGFSQSLNINIGICLVYLYHN